MAIPLIDMPSETAFKPDRDEIQLALMRLLRENPTLSQRELSEHMGVSIGLTNYCLRALVDKGWVKAQRFLESGRKDRYLYQLTPAGIASKMQLTRAFLERKRLEYKAIQNQIADLEKDLQQDGESLG